ncbi:hypothetical protein NBO_355g0004 [Nosema bombycis CQ1]|uniref:Uncharacterized protein n=1 Tax=Nosema bombycis (strain CQ1 / CVCC 102059) TaxID=578461 RepID=R0KQ57_NOSB1|nr:hypothetical protein NBO_355g0004 [Nosema bombycis CQ1]|eukprot:EOB12856.1 hypothetical protein NBO_355g0004 [Nosema bombycis CQ1]
MFSRKKNLIIYLCLLILSICGDRTRIKPEFSKQDEDYFVHLPIKKELKIIKYEIFVDCYGDLSCLPSVIASNDTINIIENELVINIGSLGTDGRGDYCIRITTEDEQTFCSDYYFFHKKKRNLFYRKITRMKIGETQRESYAAAICVVMKTNKKFISLLFFILLKTSYTSSIF